MAVSLSPDRFKFVRKFLRFREGSGKVQRRFREGSGKVQGWFLKVPEV